MEILVNMRAQTGEGVHMPAGATGWKPECGHARAHRENATIHFSLGTPPWVGRVSQNPPDRPDLHTCNTSHPRYPILRVTASP